MEHWSLRVPPPAGLVRPVAVDPAGRSGPTPGQARGPRWRRTSTGLYVPNSVDRGVVEQRIIEESARLPGNGVVTGWAALRLHGAGYFDGIADDGRTTLPVPLVVPPGTAPRPHPGVEVHRERLDPDEVTSRHGIACTRPERAVFDAARRSTGVREAVIVLDMAASAGVLQLASIPGFLAGKSGWAGLRRVIAAAALASSRSRSPKETLLRLTWQLDAGMPAPLCNWPVADASGSFVGSPDLLSESLAVVGEFDGAEHRSRARHRDDLRREDGFRRVGLEPFRVVGEDLEDVDLVVTRIHAAVRRAAASRIPRTWRIKRNPGPLM